MLTPIEAEAIVCALYDVAEGCSFEEAMQDDTAQELIPHAYTAYAKLKALAATRSED
jgi:hypothetical protein